MSKSKKIILILLYFLSPLIPIVVFLSNYSPFSTEPISLIIRYLSATTGIAAYVWLTYSFILMARPKFLDNIFGMDSVSKFHDDMSIVSLTLALGHGLLLLDPLFSAQTHYERAFFTGVLAFALMVLLLFLAGLFMNESILAKIKGFRGIRNKFVEKYNIHLSIHNFTIIATAVLFAHLMLSNSTTYSRTLRLLYVSHFLFAFIFWFNHKFIRSIKIKKHPYEVIEIIKENEEVWTLRFSSEKGKELINYKPGQYCYLTITSLGREAHPFSFSSSPLNREYFTISIKNVGDYTSKIGMVNIGDTVYIDGPYGIFNHLQISEKELVFIAGGIGIAPFLSMLSYIRETEKFRKISVIWGIRTQKDMIFNSELVELKKDMPNLSINHILSEDESWVEDCGFIDHEILDKYGSCDDPDAVEQDKHYFVCGPKLMTNLVLYLI